MKRFAPLILTVLCSLALASCAGGGGPGGIFGGPQVCNPGTQVQLASPAPYKNGVSTGVGQIIIVANGNNNILYNSYPQWQIVLADNFNGQTTGGSLNLVPDPSGPHPYPSDFYYSSSVPQLPVGRNWNVELVENGSSCTPASVGSFST